jgi:hypothetical protein
MRRLPIVLLLLTAACGKKAAVPVEKSPADAAAPLDPALAEEKAIVNRVIAIFTCFERGMRQHRDEPRFVSYRRNSFTDMFFFDRLFGERGRIEQPESALCEATLKDYERLFLATAPAVRPAKGRLGVPVDATPEFIRAAGGRTALHVLEHAELTRAVLTETSGGRARPVFELVGYGAQQSDIFRWTDLRHHAQTEPFEPAAREGEIATGQEAFVGFMAGAINDFNEQLRDGNFDRAAIFLGIACHAAQDAAFHRGITRRQLAGLRFFADHDFYGAEIASRRAEAKRWTKEILAIAKAAIGDAKRWERFLAWSPAEGFDLERAASAIFTDDPFGARLTYGALTSHWLAQLAYRRSPGARQELAEGPQGLIRWDVAGLFTRIRRTLENGGIALSRPK